MVEHAHKQLCSDGRIMRLVTPTLKLFQMYTFCESGSIKATWQTL